MDIIVKKITSNELIVEISDNRSLFRPSIIVISILKYFAYGFLFLVKINNNKIDLEKRNIIL